MASAPDRSRAPSGPLPAKAACHLIGGRGDRLAAVTRGGSELLTPLMAFAAEARNALRDFDAEVDAAGLDEEQLQEAAEPLGALHEVVFTIFETAHGFLGLLLPLAEEASQQSEAA